jgi:Pyridoxamine 5'-phosphate oxidase
MEAQIEPGGCGEPETGSPWMFGGHLEPVRLPWSWATARLTEAHNYWIATTRSDGRPHSRPVWGIWLEGAFYFSTGSLAAQHLATNPAITIHLESGSEVVIIEGVAQTVSDVPLVERVVGLYNQKYHWDIDPNHLPGPFYAVRSQLAFGWLSDASGRDRGSAFHGTATRWRFVRPSTRISSQAVVGAVPDASPIDEEA